jgi:hypothetical protein
MRSVYVYLRHTNSEAVAALLNKTFTLQKGPRWICEVNGDAYLYIDFDPYIASSHEPEDWDELLKSLGGEPQVVVAADVSGRHRGDEEVRHFIETMLTAFEGVAQDDYTSYCWSRDEVLNGHKVQGHHFFDYQGW